MKQEHFMKKSFLLFLIFTLMMPAFLSSQPLSDSEVQETTIAALTLFGFVLMTSMISEAPENVEMEMDTMTGMTHMEFRQFGIEDFLTAMSETIGTPTEGEKPIFSFEALSGTIDVNEQGDIIMDLTLSGGNIKTLKLQTRGEALVLLEANGSNFNHLEGMFANME